MLSFLKSKFTREKPLTLKTRVQLFWKWYAEVAPRFYETIEAKQCPSLAGEVSAKVNELFPGLAWVFGPGPNKQGHSFTLTAEADHHRQLVTLYWLSQAPVLPGWTFYAFRQPGSIEGAMIQIGERSFKAIEFWITPQVNLENECVDITVWHPLFDSLPEKDRWTILFLYVDEALGERGTQEFIGQIKINDQSLAQAIPLQELLPFVTAAREEQGWKSYLPGEIYTSYKIDEENRHDEYPRGDIIVGTTGHLPLINAYAKAEGQWADPLANTGADYVFVSFDSSFLPRGGEANARGEIEDALEEVLKAHQSGNVLGGAYGINHTYIDLILFDGQESLELVRKVLKEKKLPAGSEIHFFAKEKRGHRIVL